MRKIRRALRTRMCNFIHANMYKLQTIFFYEILIKIILILIKIISIDNRY